MDRDRLLLGLAAVFAGLTVVLVVVSFVRQPFLMLVALPFGVVTYLLWQHATGRLAEKARKRAQQRRRSTWTRGRRTADAPGGMGARVGGQTTGAEATEGGRTTGAEATAGGRTTANTGSTAGTRRPNRRPPTLTRAEAYRILDLDPGANEAAVRRAYRAKVKEVHPDTDGGDEEAFKRVTRAYEVLTA